MGQGVLKYIKKAGGPEFHQRGIPNSTRGVSSTPPKGCPKFLQKDALFPPKGFVSLFSPRNRVS